MPNWSRQVGDSKELVALYNQAKTLERLSGQGTTSTTTTTSTSTTTTTTL